MPIAQEDDDRATQAQGGKGGDDDDGVKTQVCSAWTKPSLGFIVVLDRSLTMVSGIGIG